MNKIISGIYQIVNTQNGHRYIGFSKDIYRRFKSHYVSLKLNEHYNEHLQRAWNKYGKEIFNFMILEECENNRDILAEREIYWESYFKENNIVLYNIAFCGKGGKISDEINKKRAKKSIGRHHSEETKQKMRKPKKNKENYKGYCKKHSEETKNIISIKNKGKISWLKGLSKETDKRVKLLSISVSKTMKEKGTSKGENNPMYGNHNIWMNNGLINKRVKPELLQQYLDQGWKRGRKKKNAD